MCGSSCCCCCPSGAPETPVTPPSGPRPTPPTHCKKFQVTIVSIDVSSIDDGFLGGTLETEFTFVVNGQVQKWKHTDLDEGVTPIGLSFFVDVPAETSTIVLQVAGIEDDPFFDDNIAGFTHTWGQSDGWGVGAQSGSASDSNITYRLNYQITCARETVAVVSRRALTQYGAARAKARKKARGLDEGMLLSWALDRMSRAGWQLESVSDKEVAFRGYGSLPRLLTEKYSK